MQCPKPSSGNCLRVLTPLLDTALGTATLEFVCGAQNRPTGERMLATVLFTDIVGSTEQLSSRGDSEWRLKLDVHDQLVDRTLSHYGGRRAKHTGDGVFALFDGPTKAARCALDLVPTLASRGIRIRAGVHIGECERRGDEWCGLAVHTGARIGAMAGPGEVLTSRTVRDLSAGSDLRFDSLGPHQLERATGRNRGLPGERLCRLSRLNRARAQRYSRSVASSWTGVDHIGLTGSGTQLVHPAYSGVRRTRSGSASGLT